MSWVGSFFAEGSGLKEVVGDLVSGLQEIAQSLDDTVHTTLNRSLPRVDEGLAQLRAAEFESSQWRAALTLTQERLRGITQVVQGDLLQQAQSFHRVINNLVYDFNTQFDPSNPRGVAAFVAEALQDAREAFRASGWSFTKAVAWADVVIEHAASFKADIEEQVMACAYFVVEVFALFALVAVLMRSRKDQNHRSVPIIIALWVVLRFFTVMFVPIEIPRVVCSLAIILVVSLVAAVCMRLSPQLSNQPLWLVVGLASIVMPLVMYIGPTAAFRHEPPMGLCPPSVSGAPPFTTMKLMTCQNSSNFSLPNFNCTLDPKTVAALRVQKRRVRVTTVCGTMGACKSTLLTIAIRTLGNSGCWNRAQFSSANRKLGKGVTLGSDVLIVPRRDGDYEMFVDTEGLGDPSKHEPSQVALASFATLLSDKMTVHCALDVHTSCLQTLERIVQGRDYIRTLTSGGGLSVSLPSALNLVVVKPASRSPADAGHVLKMIKDFRPNLHQKIVDTFSDIQVLTWRNPADVDDQWLKKNDELRSIGVPKSEFFDQARAILDALRPAVPPKKTIGMHIVDTGALLSKWIVLVSMCLNGEIKVLSEDVVQQHLCDEFLDRMQHIFVSGTQRVLRSLPVDTDLAVEKLWEPCEKQVRAFQTDRCSGTSKFVADKLTGVLNDFKQRNKVLNTIEWKVGIWSQCNGNCPTGTRWRTIVCQRGNGDPVSDSYCENDYIFNGQVRPGRPKENERDSCPIPSSPQWDEDTPWGACEFDAAASEYAKTRRGVCKNCHDKVPTSECAHLPFHGREVCGKVNPLTITWLKVCRGNSGNNGKHLTGLWFRRHSGLVEGGGHEGERNDWGKNCIEHEFGVADCIRNTVQKSGDYLDGASFSSWNGHTIAESGPGGKWQNPQIAEDHHCLVDISMSIRERGCGVFCWTGQIIDGIHFAFAPRRV